MFPLRDTTKSRTAPIVNYTIIALNLMIFFLESALSPRDLQSLVSIFGLVPYRFLTNLGATELITVFTSMFLHGGWFHVISNMWALYIFGDNIEDRLGRWRYILFYLVSGIAAALAHILVQPTSKVPVIGASGALSGVMGAYMVLFPRSRVITLVPMFIFPWFMEIPAAIFIGLWFLSQLFSGMLALSIPMVYGTYGGVAWWAHIGGFVAGIVLGRLLARRRRYQSWYRDDYWPW